MILLSFIILLLLLLFYFILFLYSTFCRHINIHIHKNKKKPKKQRVRNIYFVNTSEKRAARNFLLQRIKIYLNLWHKFGWMFANAQSVLMLVCVSLSARAQYIVRYSFSFLYFCFVFFQYYCYYCSNVRFHCCSRSCNGRCLFIVQLPFVHCNDKRRRRRKSNSKIIFCSFVAALLAFQFKIMFKLIYMLFFDQQRKQKKRFTYSHICCKYTLIILLYCILCWHLINTLNVMMKFKYFSCSPRLRT